MSERTAANMSERTAAIRLSQYCQKQLFVNYDCYYQVLSTSKLDSSWL
jgi:hypothetical protein